MEPDLASVPYKKFLVLSQKNLHSCMKKKKNCYTPRCKMTKWKIKKILYPIIFLDEYWFSFSSNLSKPKCDSNFPNFMKNNFLPKEKVCYTCPCILPNPFSPNTTPRKKEKKNSFRKNKLIITSGGLKLY